MGGWRLPEVALRRIPKVFPKFPDNPTKRTTTMRKTTWTLCLLTLAVTPLSAQQATISAAGWTPEEQMKVKAVSAPRVSPDGRRALFTINEPVMTADRSEFVTQIWMANTDGSGATQFTFNDKSSGNPRWAPDGKSFAFTSSRTTAAGTARNNLFLLRMDGGEAEQLTDGKSGVGAFLWSPDGKWIAFTMTDPVPEQVEKANKARDDARVVDENIRMTHLWLVPVARDEKGKREPRQLTKGSGFGSLELDWSPDGKTIVMATTKNPLADHWTSSDIAVIDVATGDIKPLVNGRAAESQPFHSPDGKWIAYVASDDPPTWGFTSWVYVIPAGGGTPRRLAATPDEQPGIVDWSADGKSIYVVETRGTTTELSALPVDGGVPRVLNTRETGVFGVSLNPTRTTFGLSWQSSDKAPEAFVTPVDRWAPTQITRANADVPRHALGRTEVLRWKSKDGREIEGLLTYPVGYERGKRYPMVLIIHGGPAGVFTQGFIAGRGVYPMATYASRGWAVLRANVRGSSGYGKRFRYANYKDWGGGDYQDLMSGVDHVIAMGVADPDRLGVSGWSYGGYMTSWIITQTKRFKAASIGAPVTNLMSFNGTADIPSFVPDYFGAEYWQNPEIYAKHSAMFNIKGASTPSLIQHGEQDLRVPISQGYELYTALKRQGVPVKMVTYPRQPHGLQEPRHVLDAANRNVEWFSQYLKPQEVRATSSSPR
jgi:dipeptidyl aminopeptidase/acylaminoacyl peptidase